MARPKLPGDRYASGDRRPVKDTGHPATVMQRVLEGVRAHVLNPEYGQPLFLLAIAGEITAAQTAAARIYADQRAKHDSALGLPSRTARSCDLNSGAGGYSEGRDGRKGRAGYERTRNAVFAALGPDIGSKAINAMDHVIIELCQPAHWQLNPLKAGLYAVAELHGLAGTGRRQASGVIHRLEKEIA